jgi:hypothetical protein
MMQYHKHVCWDLDERGNALDFMHVFDSSKFYFCDNLWYCSECICIIHYPGTLFTGTKSTSIRNLRLPKWGRYGTWHHSCMRPLYYFSCNSLYFQCNICENSVCNSIIRVLQIVDLGVLFELVKGMKIKSQIYWIMYAFT